METLSVTNKLLDTSLMCCIPIWNNNKAIECWQVYFTMGY